VYRASNTLFLVILGVVAGCNCSKSKSSGGPAGVEVKQDAGQSANPFESRLPFRCNVVNRGAQFSIGSAGSSQDEDDSGLDIPFGINVGQAVGYPGGFAVSAIDGRGGKSNAVLTLLGTDVQNGRRIDLGRVYGDADPPRIAGNARTLVAVLADMDAAGRTLRLMRVEEPATLAKVTRGTEVSVAQNSSTVFSVAVNEDRGIVAWDEPDKSSRNGQIALAPFLIQSLVLPKKPTIVSARESDAESPQVVARTGGFWAAWVQSSHAAVNSADLRRHKAHSAKNKQNPGPDDELTPPAVELGARDLYVNALDLEGRAIGKPLRVTEGVSHVVAYDLASLEDGIALLSWRDDDTSPGVESQIVHLGRVGLDGHIEKFRIEDESIGVGAPQLLVDPEAPAQDRAWLAVGNTGEKVSLARLLPTGQPTAVIVSDADLGTANPLVRFAGTLLVAHQRGQGVDLEPLRCQFRDP
jgi:hypothetical protein